MHPGWVETPGVARYLPTFHKITRALLRGVDDGADTAVGLVATRAGLKPGHFWHDSAQRPTMFGWQRAEDPHMPCYSDAASASKRVFENRQVRASRLVMVVIMARWTMASWWSGLVS